MVSLRHGKTCLMILLVFDDNVRDIESWRCESRFSNIFLVFDSRIKDIVTLRHYIALSSIVLDLDGNFRDLIHGRGPGIDPSSNVLPLIIMVVET